MTAPTGPHWRTRTEAARLFGCSLKHVANAIRRRELLTAGRRGMVWIPPDSTITDRRGNGTVLPGPMPWLRDYIV